VLCENPNSNGTMPASRRTPARDTSEGPRASAQVASAGNGARGVRRSARIAAAAAETPREEAALPTQNSNSNSNSNSSETAAAASASAAVSDSTLPLPNPTARRRGNRGRSTGAATPAAEDSDQLTPIHMESPDGVALGVEEETGEPVPLSIISFNVGGLTRRFLDVADMIRQTKGPTIAAIAETFDDGDGSFKVTALTQGFQWFGVRRPSHLQTTKSSRGGAGFLYTPGIEAASFGGASDGSFAWMRVEKISGRVLAKPLLVFSVYIVGLDASAYREGGLISWDLLFARLQEPDCADANVCVSGDFNARIGNLGGRSSEDPLVNYAGRKLVTICNNFGLFPAAGSPGFAKAEITSRGIGHGKRGAVADYSLVPKAFLVRTSADRCTKCHHYRMDDAIGHDALRTDFQLRAREAEPIPDDVSGLESAPRGWRIPNLGDSVAWRQFVNAVDVERLRSIPDSAPAEIIDSAISVALSTAADKIFRRREPPKSNANHVRYRGKPYLYDFARPPGLSQLKADLNAASARVKKARARLPLLTRSIDITAVRRADGSFTQDEKELADALFEKRRLHRHYTAASKSFVQKCTRLRFDEAMQDYKKDPAKFYATFQQTAGVTQVAKDFAVGLVDPSTSTRQSSTKDLCRLLSGRLREVVSPTEVQRLIPPPLPAPSSPRDSTRDGDDDEIATSLASLEGTLPVGVCARSISMRAVTKEAVLDLLRNCPAKRKAVGPDGIPLQFYIALARVIDEQERFPDERAVKAKAGRLVSLLALLLAKVLSSGRVVNSMTQHLTTFIRKKQNAEEQISSYRPITVANATSKLLGLFLKPAVENAAEKVVGRSQVGFRKNVGVQHHILALRHLVAKRREAGERSLLLFVDFANAYDSVSHDFLFKRNELMRVMDPAIVDLLHDWHSRSSSRVKVRGSLGEPIGFQRGVLQGGVLSPFLFNIHIEPLLQRVQAEPGIVGFKVNDKTVKVLAYADDLVLLCRDDNELRTGIKCVEDFAARTGMRVNMGPGKTCVMEVPGHCRPRCRPNVPIPSVDSYRYLGCHLNVAWENSLQKAKVAARLWADFSQLTSLGEKSSEFSRDVAKTVANALVFNAAISATSTLNLAESCRWAEPEKTFLAIARWIAGAPGRTPKVNARAMSGCLPPHIAFTVQCLRLFHSCLMNETCGFARDVLKEQVKDEKESRTRIPQPSVPAEQRMSPRVDSSTSAPDAPSPPVPTTIAPAMAWAATCGVRPPGLTRKPVSFPAGARAKPATTWVSSLLAVLSASGLGELVRLLVSDGRLPPPLQDKRNWEESVVAKVINNHLRDDYLTVVESSRSRVMFLITAPPGPSSSSSLSSSSSSAWSSFAPSELREVALLRSGSHSLRIHTDRRTIGSNGAPLLPHERICKKCGREAEDEVHFVCRCPCYKGLRRDLIKKWTDLSESSPPPIRRLLSSPSAEEFFALCLGADPMAPICSLFRDGTSRFAFRGLHQRKNLMERILAEGNKALKKMLSTRTAIPDMNSVHADDLDCF